MKFRLMVLMVMLFCMCGNAWGLSTERSGLIYYPTSGAALVSMNSSAESRGYPVTFKLTHSGSGVSTPYYITSGVTFSELITLEFENGAMFVPTSGVTIKPYGPAHIKAQQTQQVFDLSSGGTVAFSADGTGYPGLWGAKCDGVTDDTDEIQACMTACKTVELSGGTYLVTLLKCRDGQELKGAGMYATTLKLPDNVGVEGGDHYGIVPRDATVKQVSFHDFGYDGNEANNTSWQGVISDYNSLKANGISFPNTGIYTFSADYVSIHNVYIRNTLRNCINIQSFAGNANISNVHLKNSALDHLMYIKTKAPSNITNVLAEGFSRSFFSLGNVQGNNWVITNTVANPYSAYPFVTSTTSILSNRGTSGSGLNEGITLSNLTAYLDSEFNTRGFISGSGATVYGSNYSNIKIFQINPTDTTEFQLLRVDEGFPNYGTTLKNVELNGFSKNTKLAYLVDAKGLTIDGVDIRYRSGEVADATELIQSGVNSDIENMSVSNVTSDLSGMLFKTGGASTTTTNAIFRNIYMPNNYYNVGTHPIGPNGGDLSGVKCYDSIFNSDGPDGSVATAIVWSGCSFYNGLSDDSGVITYSPGGSTSQFIIPHGLCSAPVYYDVTVSGSGNNYIAYKATSDETNITVDFASNIPSGTNSLDLIWQGSISYDSAF